MTVFAQTQVPEKVWSTFKLKFPTAKKVEWGKESATEYEVEFKLNGKEMNASFDPDGKWLETEGRLFNDELPAPVLSTLKSQLVAMN